MLIGCTEIGSTSGQGHTVTWDVPLPNFEKVVHGTSDPDFRGTLVHPKMPFLKIRGTWYMVHEKQRFS